MPGSYGKGAVLKLWRNECVMPELHRRGRFFHSSSFGQQLIRLPCPSSRELLPPPTPTTPRNKGSLPPGKRRQVIGANSICSKRSELKAAANKDKEAH